MDNIVTVRWCDGFMKTFNCTDIKFGCDQLRMLLRDSKNRCVPLRQVRWFSTSIESHEQWLPDTTYVAPRSKEEVQSEDINVVTVVWWDDYTETFNCTEARSSCDLLWMRLENGANRHIPLRQVRWFSTSTADVEPCLSEKQIDTPK